MSLLYKTGQAVWVFGVALVIVGSFLWIVMTSAGLRPPPVFDSVFAIFTVFSAGGLVTLITLKSTGTALGVIRPSLASVASIFAYLTLFLPIAYALAKVFAILITTVPFPAPVQAGLMAMVGFLEFCAVYYLFVKVGLISPD